MQSSQSAAATVEADELEFPYECPEDSELENRVISPCGRFESFDYKGNHFEIDWDEIAPPGAESEDEEGTPHEEVMEEMRLYIEELSAVRQKAGR